MEGGYGTFKFRRHFAMVVVVPLGGERPCRALYFGSRPSAIERGATKSRNSKNLGCSDFAPPADVKAQPLGCASRFGLFGLFWAHFNHIFVIFDHSR